MMSTTKTLPLQRHSLLMLLLLLMFIYTASAQLGGDCPAADAACRCDGDNITCEDLGQRDMIPAFTSSSRVFSTLSFQGTTRRSTSVEDVWPLYGPVAGGTEVTITGQFLSAYIVTAVYFGHHEGVIDKRRFEESKVFVTTPPVNDTERRLAVEVVLNDGSRIDTGRMFQYRRNPDFSDIEPRNHLAVGGTVVTVYGTNLDSIAVPRITVTVVITRINDDTNSTYSKNVTDSEPCKPLQANTSGDAMLCRMPVVSLPDDLIEQLNNSETGTINNTRGPGVAVYWASDGTARADIYVGLKLDGFVRYQNISSARPDIKMQFALKPIVSCEYDDIDFDPNKDRVISIKGQHLLRGSRLVDFRIRIGVGVCLTVSLTDNQVDCRPPTVRPRKGIHDAYCQHDMLSLQLMVGNAEYQCSCVYYLLQGKSVLIISLSVGIGLPIIILIVVIVIFLYRRRQRKLAKQAEAFKYVVDTSTDQDNEGKSYSRRLRDYKTAMYFNQEDDYSRGVPKDEEIEYIGDLPEIEDNQYNRGLPEDEHNQYSRGLPEIEDNQYSTGLPGTEDNQYSRGLPEIEDNQ